MMTEDQAFEALCQLRWPDGVTCPKCRAPHPYLLKTHLRFCCRNCKHTFTATSSTPFGGRKLSHVKLFALLNALLIIDMRRIPLLRVSRIFNVHEKVTWVLAQKIRSILSGGDGRHWVGYWQTSRGVSLPMTMKRATSATTSPRGH